MRTAIMSFSTYSPTRTPARPRGVGRRLDGGRTAVEKGPPIPQHLRRDPQLGRNLHLRSAAALQKRDGLSFELRCEFAPRLRHQTPSRSQPSVSEVSTISREDQW